MASKHEVAKAGISFGTALAITISWSLHKSLLVCIGGPKLRSLGVEFPWPFDNPERRLYSLLGKVHGDNTHGQYNALVRRLVSYERALSCARP